MWFLCFFIDYLLFFLPELFVDIASILFTILSVFTIYISKSIRPFHLRLHLYRMLIAQEVHPRVVNLCFADIPILYEIPGP